ncbi:DeoR/GlpR family DNA-binding transcription regulator [Clostridium sp. SYSU_GA19001]|uniref:DeoR/GlpR family DNA-binding transcription regulator n=1 Tax=Clostridium caldaquaticum TaxID=2940653 RepID=UPI0020778569|nr:DeoR/GlpR family DNA-binding transcription regulator [Clostridium caldaquaticum]MCM8710011.1 DeoR/GlpR family DNA-binding transcription regulator [Clostridium caldaquaticum]
MFGAQRLEKIREIILEKQYVDVQNLSETIGVSEVTIRRDLDKLQKEGLIVKTYGGAVLNKEFISKSEDLQKTDEDIIKDYELISEIVINMIKGDEAIFLSGGKICRYIAKKLNDVKNLLVITNDIFVASELYDNPEVKVVVTGGNLLNNSGVLVGPYVLDVLKNTFVNKAFVEVEGIHLKFGYSMENYEVVEIIKKIMDISNEVIAVAHFTAFNTPSFTKLGDLDMFQKVVSNKEVPEEYKKYYYDNYIKLYTSYAIE